MEDLDNPVLVTGQQAELPHPDGRNHQAPVEGGQQQARRVYGLTPAGEVQFFELLCDTNSD